jgi:hypothetical protein
MKVKELIQKLSRCSPDAIICVEANCDCLANKVQEYEAEGDKTRYVYISDELDYIDEVFIGKRV